MGDLSRSIVSNQTGPHEKLETVVRKHLATRSLKPIARHTRQAFDEARDWLGRQEVPVILDACCGVGDSSRHLARTNPGHKVIGVDKSLDRLSRRRGEEMPENLLLIRADLNDFYRLAADEGLAIDRHFILYPNPWPKAAHLSRRWHGAPVFADIVKLGGRLELRSNWKLYLEEFQIALAIAGIESNLTSLILDEPISPFEAKYRASGHSLWQLVARD